MDNVLAHKIFIIIHAKKDFADHVLKLMKLSQMENVHLVAHLLMDVVIAKEKFVIIARMLRVL
jgi:hypothetical protein